jgi:hypothetical protein
VRVELTETVLRAQGNVLSYVDGASAQVNVRGGGAATVYAAATGGTTRANPLTTRYGRVEPVEQAGGEAWVDAGSYDLVVTAQGQTSTQRLELPAAGSGVEYVDAATGVAATDVAAIHAARDAAPTGGTIKLARGTYVANGLALNKSLTVDLTSGATLQLASATNAPLMTISAARVTIKGGTIDGNLAGQSSYHYLVESTADDTQILGVRFTNVLACQVRSRWNTKGAKIVGCLFDGPGTDSVAVTSSRNAVEIHGSHSLVAHNTFRNINQGHGVRVGRYTGTDTETVENNVVAFNEFENILDSVNESPAMKAEVNSTHCAFVGNTVKNATRWLKLDSCSHITVALNQIQGALSQDGVNAANCPFAAFIGNRLKDCGGGIQIGTNGSAVANQLENIGVGLESTTVGGIRQDTTESRGLVAFNVLKTVKRFPILLSGSYSRVLGNRLESCTAAASTAQIRVGGSGTVAGEIAHNTVISPASASGTVTAFQGTGNKLRVVDNTLDGTADQGVNVFTTASPYVAGNIVGDATTPINIGSGTTDPLVGLNPGAPAADYQEVTTDVNFTLTALVSPPVTRHTGTLTANRTVSLAGGYKGARFRVARSGAGAFNLNVAASSTKALATNQWVDVENDGTAWQIVASGSL